MLTECRGRERMMDIVERLRHVSEAAIAEFGDPMREAAAEIERLRSRYDSATDQAVKYADEIERLRSR